MYPDTPVILPPTPNRKRPLVILAVLAAVVALALGTWGVRQKMDTPKPTGTLTVAFSPSDISGVSISLSGKPQQVGLSPTKYTVAPGTYNLKLTAPGYKDFSASVPVTAGKATLVNAQLQSSGSTPITSPSQITLPADIGAVTIRSTEYYYSNSWAIVHVDTAYDTGAVLVLQRDQTSGTWKTAVGPAIGLGAVQVEGLPILVQNALNDEGYIINGD